MIVKLKETIELKCAVQNASGNASCVPIQWLKDIADPDIPDQDLSKSNDKRIKIQNHDGSLTLSIDDVSVEDSGTYYCRILSLSEGNDYSRCKVFVEGSIFRIA